MSINVNRIPTITIGYTGENFVTEISFNYSQWASLYGEGALTLEYKRYGDAVPYPVTLEHDTENHTAKWVISDIDVAKAGVGEGQLIYIVNGAIIKKSTVFNIAVNRSIAEGATPPDPYQHWVDEIIELADEVQDNAELVAGYVNDAEAYARQAGESATQASGYASEALGYKDEAKDYRDSAEGYATNAHNSEVAASTSESNASGYADEAKGYKNQASEYASNANTYKNQASGFANNAATSAGQASGFATQAEGYKEQAKAYAESAEPLSFTDPNDDGNIVVVKIYEEGE